MDDYNNKIIQNLVESLVIPLANNTEELNRLREKIDKSLASIKKLKKKQGQSLIIENR
jgi:Na+/phosphate symporter